MAQFGCLWIPDFPVWAAVRADPSLQFQPVVVHRGGRIISLSEGARGRGVRCGWSITRAQSLLPQAVVLPLDSAACEFAREQVLSALYGLTPRIESVSSRHSHHALAFFEVPTRKAQREKLSHLIEVWNASGGVATRRSIAELAAYLAPPGQTRTVAFGREDAFLDRVPMSILREAGIFSDTVQRLEWFGWHQVGHLRAMSRSQLLEQFEDGGRLLRFVHLSQRVAETRPVSNYLPPRTIEERLVLKRRRLNRANGKRL